MKSQQLICLFIFVSILISPMARAQEIRIDNPEEFKRFNPDGQKYAFVKDYIQSLKYLHDIEERLDKMDPTTFNILDGEDKFNELKNILNKDNINLRIARNIMRKYQTSENRLILKVVNIFMNLCDEQVAFNQKEKVLVDDLLSASRAGSMKLYYQNVKFQDGQNALANQRKDSLGKLLESSLLVAKVLVSNTTDEHGKFIKLGITKEERKKLLSNIADFKGKEFKGQLRQGQSFLGGGIVTIRNLLEDKTWKSLDS